MKPALLLDTHIALWWFTADERLPEPERDLIRSSRCHISLVSLWEVAIKHRLDKLPVSPRDFLGAIEDAAIRLLPIQPAHIVATTELPMRHKDPFDRLLVAQSMTETMALLTADAQVAAYGGLVRMV
ncbi:MAG: type II toxin-antitoxin system VapC family toxin [Sulfurisoma sp.]|nr:type II toxin-antitoxin system VapC family toxin [Sulfurisoma sp.]